MDGLVFRIGDRGIAHTLKNAQHLVVPARRKTKKGLGKLLLRRTADVLAGDPNVIDKRRGRVEHPQLRTVDLAIGDPIAAAIEEQDAATKNIASGVQQAAIGTQEVSRTIGEVSAAAGRTGESAGQVLHAASRLASEATGLKQEVDQFLAGVRAA